MVRAFGRNARPQRGRGLGPRDGGGSSRNSGYSRPRGHVSQAGLDLWALADPGAADAVLDVGVAGICHVPESPVLGSTSLTSPPHLRAADGACRRLPNEGRSLFGSPHTLLIGSAPIVLINVWIRSRFQFSSRRRRVRESCARTRTVRGGRSRPSYPPAVTDIPRCDQRDSSNQA